MYPALIEITTSILEDFKATRTEAILDGGEVNIDIALYMTDLDGDTWMGHTEILQRPFPPRKMMRAVCENVWALQHHCPVPWRFISMCLDTWHAPNDRNWAAESMAADHALNPASPVEAGCAVFTIDSEALVIVAYSNYRLGDDGLPIWAETKVSNNPGGLPAKILTHAVLSM